MSSNSVERKNVLDGLERCRSSSKGKCNSCPYSYDGLVGIGDCTSDLAADALELLKEQDREIERLEHDYAVARSDINYYLYGDS